MSPLATRYVALATALLAAASIAGAGCGGSDTTEVRRAVLVVPGEHNDVDWTIGAREAFEAAVDRAHVRGAILDASAGGDVDAVLDQAASGAQLVVAHDGSYARPAAAVAERTGVPTLVWGDPSARSEGRVADVEVDGAAAGYLTGIIAGKAAASKRLGILICDDGSPWISTVWNEIAGGFVAGARSLEEEVTISYARASGDGAAGVRAARDTARRLIRDGAQVILGLCGPGAVTIVREIERVARERQFVGAIGDKAIVDLEDWVLTAIQWNLEPTLRRAIADVRAGTFGERPYRLDLAGGGLEVLYTGRTPYDAYELAKAAKRKIEQGEITVPRTSDPDALAALVRGRA